MSDSTAADAPPRQAAKSRFPWRTLLVVAAVVFVMGMAVQALRNNAMTPLTPERFQAAWQLWERSGPASYDVEIQVEGRQAAHYRAEVRDGEIFAAYRNGEPLVARRKRGVPDTWSVPGMFGTISRDVENLEKFAAGNADPSTPQLRLLATFDPDTGVPLRYHRREMVRRGSNPEASWTVVLFHVVDSTPDE